MVVTHQLVLYTQLTSVAISQEQRVVGQPTRCPRGRGINQRKPAYGPGSPNPPSQSADNFTLPEAVTFVAVSAAPPAAPVNAAVLLVFISSFTLSPPLNAGNPLY
eukprot:GHVS01000430.1.p1 GENE.GHVS01000430.1~~GHVS01000430.1.p1  ORF type:complete len:105 (+),score=9.61 GHVS01000430.1:90-404(+)